MTIKVAYCSKGERGISSLERILDESDALDVQVCAVFDQLAASDPLSVQTRLGDRLQGTPIKSEANMNGQDEAQMLDQYKPDVVVLAGITQIIRQPLIDRVAGYGAHFMNMHGGLVPRYRGSSPLNWMIINGESQIGGSLLQLTPGIDDGPVYAMQRWPFGPDEHIAQAYDVVNKKLFPAMITDVLRKIAQGTVQPTPQDNSGARYFGSRGPEDSEVDFRTMSAQTIHNYVRALSDPLGGAFTYHDGNRITLWKTRLPKEVYMHEPGKAFLKRDGGVVVMANDRGLIVDTVSVGDSTDRIAATDYFSSTKTYVGK